jgi:ABC-2 type transport system ATP-binding protein
MQELEQLAGRIVLINRGEIAYDGDFETLRREHAVRRRVLIETAEGPPPTLVGAELVESQANRHEYVYDASAVRVSELLDQAAAQAQIVDVETHRAPIDEVIADIYEGWQMPSR